MGNTTSCRTALRSGTVHPHTHGEHYILSDCSPIRDGSSPHAWGTPLAAAATLGLAGFIPTRMGNTHRTFNCRSYTSVHPHTHGEHSWATMRAWRYFGSSPHAWGTRTDTISAPQRNGFIPTRMGNTLSLSASTLRMTVHPHTHGEHFAPGEYQFTQVGSSPHAWGTLPDKLVKPAVSRFIPTRMGNTEGFFSFVLKAPVHPHTHGEHNAG